MIVSKKTISLLLSLTVGVVLIAGLSWAETPSETAAAPDALSMNRFVIGGGGAMNVGTANLRLSMTAAETATGTVASTNLIMSYGFWNPWAGSGPACCVGRVGDANGLGGDEPSLGDVVVLIDAKFITGDCDGLVICLAEGDINQSATGDPTCDDISLGDISILIDYLFITGPTIGLPDCL